MHGYFSALFSRLLVCQMRKNEIKKRQTSPYQPLPLKKTVVRENLEHIPPISFGGFIFLNCFAMSRASHQPCSTFSTPVCKTFSSDFSETNELYSTRNLSCRAAEWENRPTRKHTDSMATCHSLIIDSTTKEYIYCRGLFWMKRKPTIDYKQIINMIWTWPVMSGKSLKVLNRGLKSS